MDELDALIPELELAPTGGSAAVCAAAAIETVIKAYAHTGFDDHDRRAIETIADAASPRVDP